MILQTNSPIVKSHETHKGAGDGLCSLPNERSCPPGQQPEGAKNPYPFASLTRRGFRGAVFQAKARVGKLILKIPERPLCRDFPAPRGHAPGETWLSLWESWQRIALTERAALQGGCQRGERMLPPLELNYIIVSPSHAGRLSSFTR